MFDVMPYQVFKKLKETYPTKTILITPSDINMPGVVGAYKGPEEYVIALFKREGFEVTRYKHDYETLSGSSPKMGLVFLANDSEIVPGIEVHGLIGHNIRPLALGESTYT